MPRDTYYQPVGNPVQANHLPPQPLQIQFAHNAGNKSDETQFTQTLIRNLYLVSGICLAGDWLGNAFRFPFPLNVIVVVVLIRCLIKLWQVTSGYKPHIALLAVPYAVHVMGIPYVLQVALVMTFAAYTGREFARHYVYLATSFPVDRNTAESERDRWNVLTICSAFLVIPLALIAVVPSSIVICGVVLLIAIGICLLVAIENQVSVIDNLAAAWHSWCTYNRNEEAAPGVLASPAGSTSMRLGLTVLLVSQITLLLTAGTGISNLVWGNAHFSVGLTHLLIWTGFVLMLVGIPIAITLLLLVLVALPALCSVGRSRTAESESNDWQAVTKTIQKSPNPIERESLFLGRLAHDGSPLLVPRAVFQEHAHILGDSGSGKTARGLIPLAEQLVADGQSSLMVIDLKGDSQEILQSLRACADRQAEQGHNIRVRHFSTREDYSTFAFNPFQLPCWDRLNLFQRTDVLCGALGLTYGTDYGRGYFSSANAAVLHATLQSFPQIGSFSELADRIAFVTSRPKAHGLNDGQKDAGNHVRMIADRLAAFKSLNVTPSHSPDPEVNRQAMDPAQLFANQEIFYFQLSSTLGPGSSPEIARLAMFMLLTTATLTQQRRQVYLMIDEFQRVAAQNVDAILQIARSMNVGVILANQSMLDLKRDDLVHVVEANCRYRQWYAVSSPEEQERLSKASGQTVDVLHNESTSRQQDGFDVRTTTSRGANQFLAPRLSVNDIKLASDDPRKSIALVTRGAGYSQFGGMPVIVESDFHISEQEFLARKNAAWPAVSSGTFVPKDWNPRPATKSHSRKPKALVVTEESIGDESDLFDTFLADHQK